MRKAGSLLAMGALVAFPAIAQGAPQAAAPAGVAMPGAVYPVVATAADGTQIAGEIDMPAGQDRGAVVLLVPGTGGFDRNADFGKSGTADDLIFARLARSLAQAGIAVIRYDERGRTCHAGESAKDAAGCTDPALVSRITADTKVSDMVAFAHAALADPKLGHRCLTVFAHSEGAITAAKAIEAHSLQPAAFIGLGAPMESPAEGIHWQALDGGLAEFRAMDTDHDGYVTREEIVAGWRAEGKSDAVIAAAAPKLADKRSLRAIADLLSERYRLTRAAVLAQDPAAPYPDPATPIASYAWFRQFFEDWRPVASRLDGFTGPITLLYGADDNKAPPSRNVPAAQSWLNSARLTVTVLPGLGHTLGKDAVFGPMTDAGLSAVVQAAIADAGACHPAQPS